MDNTYRGRGLHGIYVFEYDSFRGEDREWVRRSDRPHPEPPYVYRLPLIVEYYRRVRVYDNGDLVKEYRDGQVI